MTDVPNNVQEFLEELNRPEPWPTAFAVHADALLHETKRAFEQQLALLSPEEREAVERLRAIR